MFEVIIGVSVLILCIVSIAVDIKRLKAVRENTKVYKELDEQVTKMHKDMKIAIENQEANSMSIEDLTEEVLKRINKTNCS